MSITAEQLAGVLAETIQDPASDARLILADMLQDLGHDQAAVDLRRGRMATYPTVVTLKRGDWRVEIRLQDLATNAARRSAKYRGRFGSHYLLALRKYMEGSITTTYCPEGVLT